MFLFLGLVIRIIGIVVCVNKAKELYRDPNGWGLFGFCFPVVAMIWIYCMKPNYLNR